MASNVFPAWRAFKKPFPLIISAPKQRSLLPSFAIFVRYLFRLLLHAQQCLQTLISSRLVQKWLSTLCIHFANACMLHKVSPNLHVFLCVEPVVMLTHLTPVCLWILVILKFISFKFADLTNLPKVTNQLTNLLTTSSPQ